MAWISKIFKIFSNTPLPAPVKPTWHVPCPFCSNVQKVELNQTKCPNCNHEWPAEYLRDVDVAPPLFVPVIGWGGSGKTVFLYALMHRLHRLGLILPSFRPLDCTKETFDWIKLVQVELVKPASEPLKLPGKTIRVEDTIIMKLEGLTHWQDRHLVTRDVPGERFMERELLDGEYLKPFILNSHVCCMVLDFSGDDSAAKNERNGLMPHLLFNQYARVIEEDKRRQPRTLIIVLTKADRLRDPSRALQMPPNIANYTESDELAPFLGEVLPPESQRIQLDRDRMAMYRARMQNISDELRDKYLANHFSGAQIVAGARRLGINLLVTSVAAAGEGVHKVPRTANGTPDASGITHDYIISRSQDRNDPLSSRRVLDPFLLALDADSVPVEEAWKARSTY